MGVCECSIVRALGWRLFVSRSSGIILIIGRCLTTQPAPETKSNPISAWTAEPSSKGQRTQGRAHARTHLRGGRVRARSAILIAVHASFRLFSLF